MSIKKIIGIILAIVFIIAGSMYLINILGLMVFLSVIVKTIFTVLSIVLIIWLLLD
jgi:hypothetical protein